MAALPNNQVEIIGPEKLLDSIWAVLKDSACAILVPRQIRDDSCDGIVIRRVRPQQIRHPLLLNTATSNEECL